MRFTFFFKKKIQTKAKKQCTEIVEKYRCYILKLLIYLLQKGGELRLRYRHVQRLRMKRILVLQPETGEENLRKDQTLLKENNYRVTDIRNKTEEETDFIRLLQRRQEVKSKNDIGLAESKTVRIINVRLLYGCR